MRLPDGAQDRIREEVVPAFCELSPGLVLDAPLAHELMLLDALKERVRLDLVDGWRDLVLVDQVDKPVHREVRDPDRADSALTVEILHSAPLAVVIAEGLVDQVEVEIVEPQALERPLESALGVRLPRVLHPQLGGDE